MYETLTWIWSFNLSQEASHQEVQRIESRDRGQRGQGERDTKKNILCFVKGRTKDGTNGLLWRVKLRSNEFLAADPLHQRQYSKDYRTLNYFDSAFVALSFHLWSDMFTSFHCTLTLQFALYSLCKWSINSSRAKCTFVVFVEAVSCLQFFDHQSTKE